MPDRQSTNVVQPYLFFNGRCEEALEFYKQAMGGEVAYMVRFTQNPDPITTPPGFDNKIMHAVLRVGDTNVFMSDGDKDSGTFQGFALCHTVATEADADRAFNALSAGGKTIMALTKTFYSPRFGMLVDKFGIKWMVMAVQPV
mgnify:CR=1 FL=1